MPAGVAAKISLLPASFLLAMVLVACKTPGQAEAGPAPAPVSPCEPKQVDLERPGADGAWLIEEVQDAGARVLTAAGRSDGPQCVAGGWQVGTAPYGTDGGYGINLIELGAKNHETKIYGLGQVCRTLTREAGWGKNQASSPTPIVAVVGCSGPPSLLGGTALVAMRLLDGRIVVNKLAEAGAPELEANWLYTFAGYVCVPRNDGTGATCVPSNFDTTTATLKVDTASVVGDETAPWSIGSRWERHTEPAEGNAWTVERREQEATPFGIARPIDLEFSAILDTFYWKSEDSYAVILPSEASPQGRDSYLIRRDGTAVMIGGGMFEFLPRITPVNDTSFVVSDHRADLWNLPTGTKTQLTDAVVTLQAQDETLLLVDLTSLDAPPQTGQSEDSIWRVRWWVPDGEGGLRIAFDERVPWWTYATLSGGRLYLSMVQQACASRDLDIPDATRALVRVDQGGNRELLAFTKRHLKLLGEADVMYAVDRKTFDVFELVDSGSSAKLRGPIVTSNLAEFWGEKCNGCYLTRTGEDLDGNYYNTVDDVDRPPGLTWPGMGDKSTMYFQYLALCHK